MATTFKRLTCVLIGLLAVALVATGCKGGSATTIGGGGGGTDSYAASPQDNTDATPADVPDSPADAASVGGDSSTCPTKNTTSFAKTKFVLHAGLAIGAFHRYVYGPFKNGTFKKGAKGRFLAMGKGVAAALFIKREIRLAYGDAQASPALCKVVASPLQKIGDTIQGAFTKLKGGDASGVNDLNSTFSSLQNAAKGQGDGFSDVTPPSNFAVN